MAYAYVKTYKEGTDEYTHLRIDESALGHYPYPQYKGATKEEWLAELKTSADWEALKEGLILEGELEDEASSTTEESSESSEVETAEANEEPTLPEENSTESE